jgi:hypothetical protein
VVSLLPIATAEPAEPVLGIVAPALPAEPGFVTTLEPGAVVVVASSPFGRSTKNQTAAPPAASKRSRSNSIGAPDFSGASDAFGSAATARMPVGLVTASFATGRCGAGEVAGAVAGVVGRTGCFGASMPSLVLLSGGGVDGVTLRSASGGLGKPGAESRSAGVGVFASTAAGSAAAAGVVASDDDPGRGGSASVESARGLRRAASSSDVGFAAVAVAV